jgi:hypothetical protein
VIRVGPQVSVQPVFSAPSAGFLRVASLGHDTAAATGLWTAIVVSYAEGRADPVEIVAAVHACGDLDPTWSAPLAYGALMVRSLGDVDGHETLLLAGMELFPDEHWFPYSLGMSRYLNHGDRALAAHYLELAADLHGGSEVHRRAARAIRTDENRPRTRE